MPTLPALATTWTSIFASQSVASARDRLESDIDTALEEEALVQTIVTQSEDTREGMTAFMERRQPAFKGR